MGFWHRMKVRLGLEEEWDDEYYEGEEFDEAAPDKHCASFCSGPTPPDGRKFTVEEIWDNYAYFIKQVVPVAEEARVRIVAHRQA